jgi:DNA-binding response OmpR family regulator
MSDQRNQGLGTSAMAPGADCPTVLVIDDEPVIRQSLEVLLETYGFQVALARDGAQGLAAFRRIQPDLVLTDIVMPNQDGIETILTMRREQPTAKIIAMSGRGSVGNTEYIDIAARLGADAAIPKPLDAAKLISAVRALVATHEPVSTAQAA